MEDQYESPFKAIWRRLLVLAIIAASISIGACIGVYAMQKEAIKHGAAGYDTQTGMWTWKSKDDIQYQASSDVSKELFEEQEKISKKEQAEINKKCKSLGSKKSNDPACILMGR